MKLSSIFTTNKEYNSKKVIFIIQKDNFFWDYIYLK